MGSSFEIVLFHEKNPQNLNEKRFKRDLKNTPKYYPDIYMYMVDA